MTAVDAEYRSLWDIEAQKQLAELIAYYERQEAIYGECLPTDAPDPEEEPAP